MFKDVYLSMFDLFSHQFQFRYFKNLGDSIIRYLGLTSDLFKSIRFVDFFDILFVGLVLFFVLRIVRETRSIQLIKSVVMLAALYFVVSFLQMNSSAYILRTIFSNILIIIVILFGPEIRQILEQMGKTTNNFRFRDLFGVGGALDDAEMHLIIDETVRACSNMSDNHIGALIVFEKGIALNDIVESGTKIKAKVSTEILENIFYPKAPLHDGAVIIRDGVVYSAGCILPLTKNNVSSSLGTRHRAAIGMSEECDAIVLVVSEETGNISVALNGSLMENISDGLVRDLLTEKFISSKSSKKTKTRKAKEDK